MPARSTSTRSRSGSSSRPRSGSTASRKRPPATRSGGRRPPARNSGGLIGWAVGTPLTKGVGSIVAVLLLVLVAFFGLLVTTATPVHQIPERLRELSDRMTGRGDYADEDDEVYEDDEPEEKPSRRGRRTHAPEDFQATGPVDLTAFEEAPEAVATEMPE